MEIPLTIEGFAKKSLVLKTGGFFSSPKILVNGVPASRKGMQFTIRDDEGNEVIFRIKPKFLDLTPNLIVGDKLIEISPFKLHERIWLCLPMLMIAFGGALGGACGVAAAMGNQSVFRKIQNPILKYVATGAITACSVAVYFLVGIILVRYFGVGVKK